MVMKWGEVELEEKQEAAQQSQPQLTPEQWSKVEEAVKEIKDPELKEIARRLMTKAVAKAKE